MTDHGARDHATWSASATARNWHCAGALTLAQYAPPGKESIHAARGTACHEVAEQCLRHPEMNAIDFLGAVKISKGQSIEIDEELVNTAQEYIDYCRTLIPRTRYKFKGQPREDYWIEEKFGLDKLSTPFDAGGTGDFVAYIAEEATLEVADLKAGMGVVEAVGNPQGRSYGLGALLKHPGLDVQYVKVTIVQPRAPHKDGRIRSETFHVADLVEWTADLLAAMKRSKQAMDEHAAAAGNTVLLDEWRDKWLKPGKCTFCPVEATCPALRRDALSVANIWFDDLDQPRIGNASLDTDPAAVARDLDMLDMLEDWCAARRALAHTLAEQGVKLPTADGQEYFLADKIGHRKWNDGVTAADIQAATGLTEEKVYAPPKLASPSVIEKTTGAKGKPKIVNLWHAPVTGKNLVRSDRTSRQPAKSVADKYFE